MEKIRWTHLVSNEEVFFTWNEEGEEHPTYGKSNAKWIGYILFRNSLRKDVIEGKARVERLI